MGKLKQLGYELRDIAVVQAPVSFINHRAEANPYIEVCGRTVYPIFVAPMASVTDLKNYRIWKKNKLTPIIPRSIMNVCDFESRVFLAKETFVSFSLSEAQSLITSGLLEEPGKKHYICIDIAHGTLSDLYDCCRGLKTLCRADVEIMTGNVANPSAYSFYADAGIDWMRVSVGSGSRCTSSANVSIHYPMATLLDMLNEERKAYAHSHNGQAPTKIIADGGIGWFDDIQKSLALGADAVMCGKIFAECEEACGPVFYAKDLEAALNTMSRSYDPESSEDKPFRDYYGMSTKLAQSMTGCSTMKTSEGISRPVEVKYPVAKWVDNMQSYLRSCMTYTNSRTIKELRENAQVIILGGSGDAAYRK